MTMRFDEKTPRVRWFRCIMYRLRTSCWSTDVTKASKHTCLSVWFEYVFWGGGLRGGSRKMFFVYPCQQCKKIDCTIRTVLPDTILRFPNGKLHIFTFITRYRSFSSVPGGNRQALSTRAQVWMNDRLNMPSFSTRTRSIEHWLTVCSLVMREKNGRAFTGICTQKSWEILTPIPGSCVARDSSCCKLVLKQVDTNSLATRWK